MPETTAKTPKHLTPAGDECPSLPVLPEELILEILLRVPVRSLVQFRRVSKSWKILISKPQFVKDHLRASTTPIANQRFVSSVTFDSHKIVSFPVQSLFQNPQTPLEEAPCFNMFREYHVIGSCNGVLCLTDRNECYVTLWNRSINLISQRLLLGFMPRVTFHGFGYDHINDKYKLVGTSRGFRGNRTATNVYTFGANSWTVIPNFPPHPVIWEEKFVSGTLNWITERDTSDNHCLIFFLDLTTGTCGEMLVPDKRGKILHHVLSVLRVCLCLSFCDLKKCHSVVWMMKEYGDQDSWTKLMIISHYDQWLVPPFFEPLCISQNGDVLLKSGTLKLVLYDSNDESLHYLGIKGNHRGICKFTMKVWFYCHVRITFVDSSLMCICQFDSNKSTICFRIFGFSLNNTQCRVSLV